MYFIPEAICRKRNLALSSVYFPKKKILIKYVYAVVRFVIRSMNFIINNLFQNN